MAQVNVQAKPEVLPELIVSARNLRDLKNCRDSYQYGILGLHYAEDAACAWTLSAMEQIKLCVQKNSKEKEKIVALIKSQVAGIKDEWYSCKAEADAARISAEKMLVRFCEYLFHFRICEINKSYRLGLPGVTYRGNKLIGIKGVIDYVLQDSKGKYHAVAVRMGQPQESSRARKWERKPEYSVDLIHTYLGAQTLLNTDFTPEIWYLENKDDVAGVLIEKFEHRPEKNIISYDFGAMSNETILKNWQKALSGPEEKDCSACRHCAICNVDEHLRTDEGAFAKRKNSWNNSASYTERQLRVIRHFDGPMAVVAVPGSGKTAALVERTITLCKDRHVNPETILLLTFTKKAAEEISERISIRLKQVGINKKPAIMTYHALGFKVLKENPMYLGGRVLLATETDRCRLVFDVMNQMPPIRGLNYYEPFGAYGPVKTLEHMFQELDDPEESEETFNERHVKYDVDAIKEAHGRYKKAYEQRHYISFDDQISMVNELFYACPSVAQYYGNKYQYIMVDEFQDSSEDQVDMVYEIARCHGNLLVVGDDDQSIYGWRGGTAQFMLEFAHDWSGAELVYLEDNFRSNSGVTEVCNQIVNANTIRHRYEKKLVPYREQKSLPLYFKGVDAGCLCDIVAEQKANGVNMGDIAILARTNSRLQEVSSVLEGQFPISTPKDYLIEDAVFLGIKDVLSLYYDGLMQDVPLFRTLRRLGAADGCLKNNKKNSLYEELISIYQLPEIEINKVPAKNSSQMQVAFDNIARVFSSIQNCGLHIALRDITEKLYGFTEHMALHALYEMADERGIVTTRKLYQMMVDMTRYKSSERVGYYQNPDAISILTCHDAKGMEFQTVIIYGMEDFSANDEEEIRVLYVATSRAKDNLIMLETNRAKHYEAFENIAPYVKVVGRNGE